MLLHAEEILLSAEETLLPAEKVLLYLHEKVVKSLSEQQKKMKELDIN